MEMLHEGLVPEGWQRVSEGKVQQGDKAWHYGLQQWQDIGEGFVGKETYCFNGLIRKIAPPSPSGAKIEHKGIFGEPYNIVDDAVRNAERSKP